MKYFVKPGSVVAAVMLFAVAGQGQTRLDLRNQIRNRRLLQRTLDSPVPDGQQPSVELHRGRNVLQVECPGG